MIINEDMAMIINNAAGDQAAPDNQRLFQEAEGNLLKQLAIHNFEGDPASHDTHAGSNTWKSLETPSGKSRNIQL